MDTINDSFSNDYFSLKILQPLSSNKLFSKSSSSTSSKCQMCSLSLSKYKCPRCLVRTCSLDCSKSHKRIHSCSGLRDKTAFVPMKIFNDNNLISDYRFLEETERVIDAAKRNKKIKLSCNRRPKFLKILRTQCKSRSTSLYILPSTFSRHQLNHSYYDIKKKTIDWTMEWIHEKNKYYTKCNENTTLKNCLEDLLKIEPIDMKGKKVFFCTESKFISSHTFRYITLDMNKSLKENLKRKSILEFPTFIIKNN